MQATKITPGSDGMVPSAAAWRCLQRACSIPSLLGRWECTAHFCPWHSNSSERRTKHIFPVNLAQIHSAVPEIFDSQTDSTKNRTWRSSLRAAKKKERQTNGSYYKPKISPCGAYSDTRYNMFSVCITCRVQRHNATSYQFVNTSSSYVILHPDQLLQLDSDW